MQPHGVLFRHTMRNALGPIVVIIGLSIPLLLSGALIVEDLFNYQGLGYETVYAATNYDLYTVLGITIVVTIATVLGNIAGRHRARGDQPARPHRGAAR